MQVGQVQKCKRILNYLLNIARDIARVIPHTTESETDKIIIIVIIKQWHD